MEYLWKNRGIPKIWIVVPVEVEGCGSFDTSSVSGKVEAVLAAFSAAALSEAAATVDVFGVELLSSSGH